MRSLAHGGLALATSLVATVNTVFLFLSLRLRLDLSGGKKFLISMAKMTWAALIMAVAIVFTVRFFERGGESLQLHTLGICLLLGGIVYGVICLVLRVEEMGEIRKILGRRRGENMSSMGMDE